MTKKKISAGKSASISRSSSHDPLTNPCFLNVNPSHAEEYYTIRQLFSGVYYEIG